MDLYAHITDEVARYYNKLWEHSKVDKFEQGKLNLQGNLEFVKKGNIWSTDELYTVGSKGTFRFFNLPTGMVIKDYNSNQVLDVG